MPLHLAFDGGGTKLVALVYDDNFTPVARRRSGGTNATFLGEERVAQHCEDAVGGAIDEAYAKTGEYPVDASGVVVGPGALIKSTVSRRTADCKVGFLGEAHACRLAGAFDEDGCIVIAGTGSGAAWVRGERVIHRGGYGPEIGDEGSGYWIGSRGIRAAVSALNGWGEPTALAKAFLRYTKSDCGEDAPCGTAETIDSMTRGLYGTFYNHSDPVPRHMKISGFAPYVGEACDAGDPVAQAIITEAGRLLARQTAALYRIYGVPAEKSVALCGGAWHASKAGALGRAFREEFARADGGAYKDTQVIDAILPPMAAGAVLLALRRGTLETDRQRIIDCFS